MTDIWDEYTKMIMEAEERRVYDDMVRMWPETDPARHAELLAEEEAREKERAEHRATCKCPYCGL